MCRTGGRRCPGCNGETARAAHNARRRRNRQIKREIVEQARKQGAGTQVVAELEAGPPDAAKRWAAENGLPEHLHPGRGHTAVAEGAQRAPEPPAPPAAAPAPPAPAAGGRGRGGRRAAAAPPPPVPPSPAQPEWSTPRLAAQIAATTSGQGAHRDERNLLSGSEKAGKAATGGTNETRRVELDNGVIGYHKPFAGLDHNLARFFGHRDETGSSDAQQPIHEVAAWRVARELGEPWDRMVPPVVLREFNGEMGSFALERPGIPHRRPGDVDPEEANAAAFFDCLIGQQDRHPGNYLAQGDRLTLIDHGYSFARSGDHLNWSFLQRDRVSGGDRDKRLSGPEIAALDKFLDSKDSLGLAGVLAPDRLEAMRDRAERMRRSGQLLLHGDY